MKKEVTCIEDGSKQKICAYCGYKVTEVIPSTGHVWNEEYTVDKESTCIDKGSESILCAVCGEKDETTLRTIEKKDPAYSFWTVTKEATCTEDGSKEKACVYYRNKASEVIKSIEHQWRENYNVDKQPAYTEEGFESIHRSVCNLIKEGSERSINMLVVKGWVKNGGGWKYYKEDGTCATGWLLDGGKWYYMNSDGIMQTGWQKIEGKWYYFKSSGAMVTGRQQINGKWYTFSNSGVMQ